MKRRLSYLIPLPFHTTYGEERGDTVIPRETWWWMWAGRVFAHRTV